MKKIKRHGLVSVILACHLCGVTVWAEPCVASKAQPEEYASMREVFPEGVSFEEVKKGNEVLYYRAIDKDNKFVGVTFKVNAKGYSGDIETLVGMLKDGRVAAIKVLSQEETDGVGSRVGESFFTQQFKLKNPQELSGIQTITGATISSSSVTKAVKAKAEEIAQLIKEER